MISPGKKDMELSLQCTVPNQLRKNLWLGRLGQKEHHKKMTFQDELKMFLKEYQVEYNEEFI